MTVAASDAFAAGGWPAVAIMLASAVIVYLLRKVDRLEQRDEKRTVATEALLSKREERDQERLKTLEDRERRAQEARER